MLLPELKERVISTHSLLGNTSGKINSKHFKRTEHTHTHTQIRAETLIREVQGEKLLDKTLHCPKKTEYHYVQVDSLAKQSSPVPNSTRSRVLQPHLNSSEGCWAPLLVLDKLTIFFP